MDEEAKMHRRSRTRARQILLSSLKSRLGIDLEVAGHTVAVLSPVFSSCFLACTRQGRIHLEARAASPLEEGALVRLWGTGKLSMLEETTWNKALRPEEGPWSQLLLDDLTKS